MNLKTRTPSASTRLSLAAIAGIAALAAPSAVAGNGGIGYQNDFAKPVATEWSPAKQSTTPRGDAFLGPYDAGEVSLSIPRLPDHQYMVIAMDLYVIGDWQGEGQGYAPPDPSRFSVAIDGQAALMDTTIAIEREGEERRQSYPDPAGTRWHPAGKGSFLTNALGFTESDTGKPRDAVYRVILCTRHSGKSVTLRFAASGLKPGAQWGIDNIVVEVSSGQLDVEPSVVGPNRLEDYFNEFFNGSGNPGTNPLRGDFIPSGGSIDDGGGPSDNPTPKDPPPVPAPAAAVVLTLGGALAMRRRR